MKTPLLTICIPTYNAEKTIKKTLESILAQTYPCIEILVSDNGSSDNTLKIVRSFNNPKIIVRNNIKKIKTDKPYIGSYDNYNGCLQSGLIQGEFVAFYHADDIYHPDIAKKEVEFLLENPSAGAVFSMGNMIDPFDTVIGQHKIPKILATKNLYQFQDIFKAILIDGNTFLLTPTFMARKNIFDTVGLFSSEGDFGTSADLEMWLRIIKKYPIGILKDNLINRRINGGGATYNFLRTDEADYFKVMDYYLKFIPTPDKKYLNQYAYQKDFDDTLRAMSFLMQNKLPEAKRIINNSFSVENFKSFASHVTFLRTKVFTLKIILYLGINFGLGTYLAKMLRSRT